MSKATGGTALAQAEEQHTRFPAFLRYDAPNVAPGLVFPATASAAENGELGLHITPLPRSEGAYHASLSAAKLAAAKSAAREAFLATQGPVAAAAGASQKGPSSTAMGTTGTRKDPAHRLPTPPVAGRRAGARPNRSTPTTSTMTTHGQKATGGTRLAAPPPPAATVTAAPVATSSFSSPAAAPRDFLCALMRTGNKPESFTAQILDSMFPPRTEVIDLEGELGRFAPPDANAPKKPVESVTTTGGSSSGGGGGHSSKTLTAGNGSHAGDLNESDEETDARAKLVLPVSTQHVSRTPATREEVALLHDALRHRLEERRAKPCDLCPIRREVYHDVFCELVRQVTVEEPARGVLLQRLKEDADHTLAVHADLLARAHFFAARKTQLIQQGDSTASTASSSSPPFNRTETVGGMRSLRERLEALQKEKAELEARRHALLVARDALERRIDEERLARNKVNQDELAYLRRVNQQLSLRLKAETERASPGNMGGEDAAAVAPGEPTTGGF